MELDDLQGEAAAAHRLQEEAAFAAEDARQLRTELAASKAAAAATQKDLEALQRRLNAAEAGGGRECELENKIEELQRELHKVRRTSGFTHPIPTITIHDCDNAHSPLHRGPMSTACVQLQAVGGTTAQPMKLLVDMKGYAL